MSDNRHGIGSYLKVGGAGFAMGVANVIPGVSGGTMAFILGIFEELLDAIAQIASRKTLKMAMGLRFKEMYENLPWRFLLSLAIGLGAALGSASILFTYLLANYQSMTYAFFFGLIMASVLVMFKDIGKWSLGTVAGMAAGAVFAGWLVSMVPATTPNTWYWSLGSGVVVICAMILPGISGSFLLLLFGQYNYVWGAVADFSKLHFSLSGFSTLIWTAIGAAIGLGAFVHLLNYLLKTVRNITMSTLIGFMIGSLWRLWPWQDTVQWTLKTTDGKTVMTGNGEYLAAAAQGLPVEQLEVRNVLPATFDWTFCATAGLVIFGVVLVLAIEMTAKRKAA
ncbi:MAG: DUF368 domain-containing protein [Victivallaceae bacterium]|nr:DUF368 domain-containing protein [Victivallaceae bacterium]